MRKNPPLILHGGMPKTGTSSIQSALSSEAWRAPLGAVRVRPVTVPMHKNPGNCTWHLNALRHVPVWRGADLHAADLAYLTERIRATLDRLPAGHAVLLSAEGVGDVAARDERALRDVRDYLAQLFSGFRVVLYLREPLSYACSRFQEGLRAGQTPQRALRSAIAGSDIAAMIRNLRNVFGGEAVELRPFDPLLMSSPDVVADFTCAVLGMDPAIVALAPRGGDVNLGLTMEMAEILVQLYRERGISPQTIARPFGHTLGRIQRAGSKLGPAFFAEEDRRWLIAATDKARAEALDLLGSDPFPSYRPFASATWRAEDTPPEVHRRNTELLRDAIAACDAPAEEGAELGSALPMWGAGAGGSRVAPATRSTVLDLLGRLYDRLDHADPAAGQNSGDQVGEAVS